MLSPFLVLGLGGSGGKTLQTLRSSLLRQLHQAGWQSDALPSAWQLVQIDVPPTQDEISKDLPPEMKGDSYVGLVTPGTTYAVVDSALSTRIAANELARHAMAGWRPSPDAVTVPIERGAGQYRAIGRFLTVYHIERVKKAIDQAIVRTNSSSSAAELKEVAALLGQDSTTAIGSPTAIVVASIAGGTGAGMFMDVCDVLRSTGNTWAGESMGIFFTPDVFDELPPQARSGVRPNALASLSEILAGFWDQDGFGEDERALLRVAGIAPAADSNRIGPRFPFLMGRSNGAITFQRQNDIYRSAGRALSSWVLSPEIQSSMSNYVTGNWVQSAQMADAIPFKDRGQEAPFQALGFARVSLGRDLFLQFASERIARGSIERLLAGHLEDKAFDDHRSDGAILQEKVDRALPDFVQRSGLDLTREKTSEILDLTGFKRIREDFGRLILGRVPSGQSETEMAGEDISLRAEEEMRGRASDFDNKSKEHFDTRLSDWAALEQERFVQFLLEQSSIHGLPVTRELTERLSHHMRGVIQHHKDHADGQRQQAGDPQIHVDLDRSISMDNPDAQEIVGAHVRKEALRNVADALDAVAELLEDFRQGAIVPAMDVLKDSQAELTAQEAKAKSWPRMQDKQVPGRLRPTPNERTLLDPSRYVEELESLLQKQSRGQDTVEANNYSVSAAVAFPKEERADRVKDLMRAGGRWVPTNSRFRQSATDQPRKLSIRLDVRPHTLRRRAEDFVATPNTVLGRYVREELSDHLSDNVPAEEREKRLQAFEREFNEAMRASAPMASVNPNAVVRIHEMDPGVVRVFSGVPFRSGTEAFTVAERVLTDNGLDGNERAGAFHEANTQHIDIFTMLASPMEPSVFDSLVKPIKEQWDKASAGTPDDRAEFWRFRRTRPLPQAIPMAPHVRRAMVRGWFTGRLLGQVRDTVDEQGSGELEIFVPSHGLMPGSWRGFPLPLLLPRDAGPADRLAGVLKTAAIAILEANNGDMGSMEAYARLRDLGANKAGGNSDYETANAELDAWIRGGTLRAGAPDPREDWAGSAQDSIETRQTRLLVRIQHWHKNYEHRIFAPVARTNIAQAPRSWELRHDYLGGLAEMYTAVSRVDDLGSEDF